MSKKVNTKDTYKTPEVVNDNAVVLVKVEKNFRDATDNNRPISAGPNCYYKTTKERADRLVASGFCKYDDEETATIKEETTEVTNDISDASSNVVEENGTITEDETNLSNENPNE